MKHNYTKTILCIAIQLCISAFSWAQSSTKAISNLKQTFNPSNSFIENIGQYGKQVKGYEQMGNIQYGFEGFGIPILFTPKGIIHLQRKIENISKEEEERLERQGLREDEIENRKIITDRTITMEWIGANENVEIVKEQKTTAYHTYGLLTKKAYGYKEITYKNIYDGVDIIYSFINNNKTGFEYSLIVHPEADLTKVKMRYGGDVKTIKKNSKGFLVVSSDINGVEVSTPISYYGDKIKFANKGDIQSDFKISGAEIEFDFPKGYDKTKTFVIDPFVTATTNLTGLNAGKAKDVDFDYAGNAYVIGGGNGNAYQLAKYDPAGVLLWTFAGTTTIPSWTFGPYYGGFVVEKNTGNIYLGQGFSRGTGYRVVRISTTGLYDNYISTGNPSFNENWKMYWNCNNGTPQILVVGGGTSSTLNLGIITPPSTTITPLNITGVAGGCCQDMADMVFDPVNFDIYSLFASFIGTPTINNKIFKNTAPYSGASVAWSTLSGYNVMREAKNRPYLVGPLSDFNDNSTNILALNGSYLFYWDGKNLKAFNKATGAAAGTPLITSNTALMQGGIIVDACNNVFVGEANGVIKVYNFDGSTFNDAPADITIPGFAGKAVYDIVYDEAKKLIYTSGDGFLASFDISSYCATNIYTLNIANNCATASATATLSPTPPAGSTITYVLYIGTTQIATNTTGIFTGLLPNTTYTIIATINFACSGTQVKADFVLPAPTIVATPTATTCGNSTGQISIVASGTLPPYIYSLDGITYVTTNPFTGLAAGLYTVYVKDANGCINKTSVTILNSNGPTFTFAQTNATCGNNTGTVTVTASGGTTPYQYSINNGTTYQTNNFFTGLLPGSYTHIVKDATGCTNAASVTIISGPAPQLNAIPASATCGNTNGTITAFGSGGTAPLQYSINGNTFQSSNLFTSLTPGTYTVTVKDAIGCTKSVTVTVANNLPPTVTAVTTPAACGNINGSITATGVGGVAPLQYSINGILFQPSNIFTGLAPGTYTVNVKDATGCVGFVSVVISSTGGPTATATSVSANCGVSNGSITITGIGTAPFTYSINNTTFVAGNTFTGLAAGNYIAYVRDALGCIGAVNIVVTAVAGPTVTAVATPASCTVNNGTITATGSGGSAPLQYSIDGITFSTVNSFSNLTPNTYTVTVKDALNCLKTTTIIVGNASGLGLSLSAVNSSCNNNGVITATPTGGVGTLQYSINGGAYQASNIFSGLATGTYTITVQDANNCTVAQQATVASVTGLAIIVTTPLQATCASANAVIIANGSGGIAPLTYSINGTTFQSSGTFLNVGSGNYTVTVKDATGCIASQAVTITNTGAGPGINTFTVRVEDAYACNTNVGKIDQFRVNGANCATCTYSINFGAYLTAADPIWANMLPGTYAITARDANGCTKTILATIGQAVLSTATYTVIGTACNTSNGSITLTGVGPNTPYHASITGVGGPFVDFNTTHTFTGLAPGTYTIIIADDEDFNAFNDPGNCLTYLTVIVPSIGGPTIATTQTPVTCNTNNGSITVTGSGSSAPYTYNINGGAYGTSGVFNNLAPGTYTVSVRDGTGCVNSATIVLATPSMPSITGFSLPATCGINNGSITVTAGTGGTAPYEYSINGTIFLPGNTFTDLAPGSYTVYIKDANNCYTTIPLTVSTVTIPKVTAFTIAASCNNNDGSIFATGTSGSAPYQFSLNGTVYQSSTIFNGLAAGFYTVYMKDNRGCVTTTGVSIGNIGAPTFTTTVTASRCGDANGSIAITAAGGTAPYTYSNDGGVNYQSGASFTNLATGNYSIYVKDFNGCITSRIVLMGNTAGPQTLTAVVSNASCGFTNGSVTLTATGGTPVYQYSKDNITYQASNILTGFGAGTHTVYVRDANLCPKSISVAIINLEAPTVTAIATPSSCGLNDGTITATATGGTLALSYSKDGVTFQPSNIFTGLAAGPYTITVRDGKNCTNTTTVTVVAPTPTTPTFAAVAPICSGTALTPLPTTSLNNINGTWSPALNNTASGTYTFTPTTGQCATAQNMSITVNPVLSPTINCGTSTSNSVSFTWPTVGAASGYNISYTINGGVANNIGAIGNTLNYTINSLSGGDNVTITVTPTGSGCFAAAVRSCTAAPCSPATATVTYGTPFCKNITTAQAVTLNGSGTFTGGTFSGTAGLTVDAITGAITPSTSTSGNHIVTYTLAAAGGCSQVVATAPVTINPLPTPTILSSLGTTLQLGQTTTFSTSIPYGTYQWYSSGVLIPGATSATHDVSVQGNYAVEVTDANGCIGISEYFTLIVLDGATYVLNGYKQQDDSHFLQWRNTGTTAVPLSIERSIDGIQFNTIAFINNLNQLQYTSQQTFTEPIYYYRLKWKNNITQTRYSNTVIIHGKKQGVQLVMYPNPTEGLYNISSNKLIQQVVVLNTIGEIIFKDPVAAYQKYYNASILANGNYIIKVLIEGKWNILQLQKQ